MKFNKVIMGLGMASLLLTSCDKAAEQSYTPAAPVATPPAYFDLNYESDIVLEENQESFSIPVYRAEKGAPATVEATLVMTTSANVNGLFKLPGDVGVEVNKEYTTTFSFPEGSDVGELVVTYPWSEMENLPGIAFDFDIKVAGNDTEYFLTHTDYTVMYVPWQNPVDEAGNTTCYFLDKAIYSGFKLSGSWDCAWKYEVEIQYNPVALDQGQLIYRCITPYANTGHWGPDGYAFFDGYDDEGNIIPNNMYINATDPHNVYLCDKKGNPLAEAYNTMYVFTTEYGPVSYYDTHAYTAAGQPLIVPGVNGDLSSSDVSSMGYINEEGNKIIFPEKHFIVVCPLDDFATNSYQLEIWLPGAKEELEWEELGFCEFTDDVASLLELGESQTYEVPVWQNIKDPNRYKVMNPYTEYWPDGNDMDDEYSLIFDVTNPDCIILELSETGLQLPYGRYYYDNILLNAANFFINYSTTPMTASQVIAEGLNDTYDAATGLIDCQHVIIYYLISDEDEELVPLWEDGSTGIQVKLPDASGARGYCTAAKSKVKKIDTARRLPRIAFLK